MQTQNIPPSKNPSKNLKSLPKPQKSKKTGSVSQKTLDTTPLAPPRTLESYDRFMDLMAQFHGGSLKGEDFQMQMRLRIMSDLEIIYQTAKAEGNMPIALKVKELQGKDMGMFQTPLHKGQHKAPVSVKPLSHMSLEELRILLQSSCDELGVDMDALLEDTKGLLKRIKKS